MHSLLLPAFRIVIGFGPWPRFAACRNRIKKFPFARELLLQIIVYTDFYWNINKLFGPLINL